jgi:PAS domain S-box-containing protein
MEVARELVIPLAIGIQQARLYEHVQHHADELEKEVQRRTRALRASEARFRTIFEETATGIVRINHKGQMLDSNPALQTMLGYSDEELHGQPFTEFARHPDDIGVDADLLADLLADRQSSYRQKVRYICKNGQTVWANLTISTVRKGQYTSPLAIAMVEDITEQKQAEEALIQSEKLALAGQLAASLAHEINNPLQSVIGCLGLAQESLADGDDPGPLLQIAMEELRRAAGIVGDMRDFNRPTDPGEREPTDLNALIKQVLTLSEKKCREHQVNVQWQRVDDLPCLMLAPSRIHQVFLNLTLNAVEAMPDGGELRIHTTPTDDPEGVRITFADTGIGIAPDRLPHIFDPFYTTKDDGLGLGLFISRNIVREHGGEVKAQSQVGEGTIFTVWLPTGD